MTEDRETLFTLGRVVATPGALRLLAKRNIQSLALIARHADGDWSEMDLDDQKANLLAVRDGLRVFSAYWVSKTERVWVITEHDRSSTTVLLPSEY
jgi:hypothetical protein